MVEGKPNGSVIRIPSWLWQSLTLALLIGGVPAAILGGLDLRDQNKSLELRVDEMDEKLNAIRDSTLNTGSTASRVVSMEQSLSQAELDISEQRETLILLFNEISRQGLRTDSLADFARPDVVESLRSEVRWLKELHGIASAASLVRSYDPSSPETPSPRQVHGPR